jgi:hypothetical protein
MDPENPAGERAGDSFGGVLERMILSQTLAIRELVDAGRAERVKGSATEGDTAGKKATASERDDDFSMLVRSATLLATMSTRDGGVCEFAKKEKTASTSGKGTPGKGTPSKTSKGGAAEQCCTCGRLEACSAPTPTKKGVSAPEKEANSTPSKGTTAVSEKETASTPARETTHASDQGTASTPVKETAEKGTDSTPAKQTASASGKRPTPSKKKRR